jgi:hypothetical protein
MAIDRSSFILGVLAAFLSLATFASVLALPY